MYLLLTTLIPGECAFSYCYHSYLPPQLCVIAGYNLASQSKT